MKRRKLLAISNSCNMKNCRYYVRNSCAHDRDTVDKVGINCCPLLDGAVDRNNFRG